MHLNCFLLVSQSTGLTGDQYLDFSFLFMLIPLVTFKCHLYVNDSQLYTCNLPSAIQLHTDNHLDSFTWNV